jgi:hypothetical protein
VSSAACSFSLIRAQKGSLCAHAAAASVLAFGGIPPAAAALQTHFNLLIVRFIWKQPMAQATENRLRLPRCEHPTTQKLKNSFRFQVLAL